MFVAMRTFVALCIHDGPASTALAKCRDALSASRADVRWVSAHHFHITVRFLGETDGGALDAAKSAVAGAASAAKGPLEVTLGPAGCFLREGRPSAVWMQAVDDGAMADVEAAVSASLERAGFPREPKPFRAHVTLGRAKSSRGAADLLRAIERWNANGESVQYRFETLTLMESRLTPQGPVYTPLLEAPLGAGVESGG
jgi:RNA 2',3'-cyclic 3'-phosphodiesterase